MNFKSLGAKAIFATVAFATAVSAAPDPNYHIYLAFGQSNMEGQGVIESQDQTVDSRFQVLWTANDGSCASRTKGNWYDATPPLASCKGKLGPVDYFGRTMLDSLPSGSKVGVVVVAVAGSDIQLFEKDNYSSYVSSQSGTWMASYLSNYDNNPYGRLVEMAKKAQEVGVIKGILLHQGETNSGQSTWPSRVKGIYDNLISDLGLTASEVPLVAGEVHPSGSCAGMNSIIAKLPDQASNFYVASAQGITGMLQDGQNVHFDAAGYRELGKRYAAKMMTALRAAGTLQSEVSSSSVASVVESSSSVAPAVESSASLVSSSSAVLAQSSSSTDWWANWNQSSSSVGVLAIHGSEIVAASIGRAVVQDNRVVVPVSLNGASIKTAKVYDMLGGAVLDFTSSMESGTLGFETSAMPSGNYIVSIQAGSLKSVQKISIK